MCRITSWTSEARITAWLALLIAAFLPCCLSDDSSDPPKIVMVPNEAHPKDIVKVTIYSDHVRFSECAEITTDSVVFQRDGGGEPITVHHVQLSVDGNTLDALIYVDANADLGTYDVDLSCTSNTILRGSFQVTKGQTEPSFDIEPGFLPAGSQEEELIFSAPGENLFEEGLSQVVFGDGAHVSVNTQNVISSDEMVLEVDVFPTAPIDEPMNVVVFTGNTVSRGSLEITEQSSNSIWIEGDNTFLRPSSDEKPIIYTIRVMGSNVNFTSDEGSDSTTVSFPVGENDIDSPGIEVLDLTIIDSTSLDVTIQIREYAYIGTTRLRVTTGAQDPETQMNVEATEGDPALQLSPKEVPVGIADYLVLATAINFEFLPSTDTEPATDIQCVELGCQIAVSTISAPTKQLVLGVTLDPGFKGNATVEVTTPDNQVIKESLLAIDFEGMTIFPLTDKIIQGVEGEIVGIEITEGEFVPSNYDVRVLERSGIEITDSTISFKQKYLYLEVNVAADAPIGPALVRVNNDGTTLETLIDVQPSKSIPWITVSPDWTAGGRRTASLELTSHGFGFDEATPSFLFDDPAVKYSDFTIDDENTEKGVLEVKISPSADPDMTVLYAQVGEVQTAATFRVLHIEKPRVVSVEPQAITRGAAPAETLTIETEGIVLGATLAETMDNIGVNNLGVLVMDDHRVKVDIELAPTGPIGWIGILLKSDWHSLVAPVQILGTGADAITMSVEPEDVSLGSGPFDLSLTLPPQASFVGSSEIYTGLENTYSTLPDLDIDDQSLATTILDVGFDINESEEQIPIYATADKGAAVGFVNVNRPVQHNLDGNTPWQDTLTTGETAILEIAPGFKPSILFSSAGHPDFAKTNFELLASNNLDTTGPVGTEFIWDKALKTHFCVVSPDGDPGGEPIDAKIKSLGSVEHLIEPPGDSTDPEYYLGGDPCGEPLLADGTIGNALDTDRIVVEETTCPIAFSAIARSFVNRPWITPDLYLEARDNLGNLITSSQGWPSPAYSDPKVYLDSPANNVEIHLGGQMGSTGDYLVNIRRPYVIREMSLSVAKSYIEFETNPSASLDDLVIELVDAQTGTVLESLSFLGKGVVNDGIILIAGDTMSEADIVHPVAVLPTSDAFVLRLVKGGEQVDAVKVGEDGYDLGEGDPIVDYDDTSVIKRLGSIDTNDNLQDFVVVWVGSY